MVLSKFINKFCIPNPKKKIVFSYFCTQFYSSLDKEEKRKWSADRIKKELPPEFHVENSVLMGLTWKQILSVEPYTASYNCKHCSKEPVEYKITFYNNKHMIACGTCTLKKKAMFDRK